jgi:CBS domain-containing membrane protein
MIYSDRLLIFITIYKVLPKIGHKVPNLVHFTLLTIGISLNQFISKLIRGLLPEPTSVSWSERLRSVLGVVLGLMSIIGLGLLFSKNGYNSPWIVASMGASAFLLFVLPSSPMAQPWAVIGGSCVSAFVGIVCASLIHNLALLIPLSVGLAILIMFALRTRANNSIKWIG